MGLVMVLGHYFGFFLLSFMAKYGRARIEPMDLTVKVIRESNQRPLMEVCRAIRDSFPSDRILWLGEGVILGRVYGLQPLSVSEYIIILFNNLLKISI